MCLPNAEEIRERYEVREALETQAARLYAQKASVRDKLELERMSEHMDALFNQSATAAAQDREFLYAVHNYHLQFHLRIAQATSCNALRDAIEKNHVLIFNWLFDVAASRPPLPPRFHRELAESLNRGNVEAADRAMRLHVRHGLDTVAMTVGSRAKDIKFERVK